jgi:hypothetical protein
MTVAAFHARATRSADIDRAGTPERVLACRAANTAALRAEPMADQAAVELVDRLARRFVGARAPLFAERIAGGRVVDGHRDLKADDIFCLDDGPRILDCIEFDPSLRHGDSLADQPRVRLPDRRPGSRPPRPFGRDRADRRRQALVADEWDDAVVVDTTGPPHASLSAALRAVADARPT